ncbi:MAG: hypothetical protein WC765_07330 [Phycisphaerae bacterium]|jgi:hypothetical protein
MVRIAEDRISGFSKLSDTKRRAVFHAMQCLSRYDRAEGARLPQWAFSSEKIGRFVQEGIVACGLGKCMDWNSWKPTGYDFRNAKARAFIPCLELIWADTGREVVSSFADYCRGEYELREPLHRETRLVLPCACSGVEIPGIVVRALTRGTGLYCDFAGVHTLLLHLPEDERIRKLCATFAAVGRMPGDELRPLWKQHEWGRLYSSLPAVVNMPTLLLPSLRSTEGLPLWCVDFSSFELRIACNLTGQCLPEGDIYELLAKPSGIGRERAKAVVNPLLHGQTNQQTWFAQESGSNIRADRPLVEKEMARSLPALFKGLDHLRSNDSILQRNGARVFFPCMGAAMDRCGIAGAGVPKHDGWVFAGDESQAKEVKNVFETEAERITGMHFPVKLARVF